MRTKVLTDITGESESDALTHSYNGYNGLFENLNFTLPIIPFPTWKEHIDNFRDSIGIAVYGGGPAIINKNNKREIVNNDYRLQANYVNLICNGDKAKAESSGFIIYDPKVHGALPSQEAKNMKESGKFMAYSRLMPEGLIARLFQTTQTPDVENSWKNRAVTKRQTVILSNNPVNTITYIRVALITVDVEIEFDEVFWVMVT